MAEVAQHLEDLARDLHLLFQRLVGIGVRAHGDDLGHIAGRAQFLGQQHRRIGLGEYPGFNIHPGRHAQIGVAGPGEAVDAAMLAAPKGIDRLVEGNVRRLVAGDDGAGGVMDDFGADGGRGIIFRPPAIIPAIVQQCAGLFFKTAHRIGDSAPAVQDFRPYRGVQDNRHGLGLHTHIRTKQVQKLEKPFCSPQLQDSRISGAMRAGKTGA